MKFTLYKTHRKDSYYDRALVPYLDLFNHSPGCRSRIEMTKNAIYLTCNEDVKEGAEIFIDYGPYSNTQLLRQYGFTIKNNAYGTMKLDSEVVLNSVQNFVQHKSNCDETHLTYNCRKTLLKKYRLLNEPFTIQSGNAIT